MKRWMMVAVSMLLGAGMAQAVNYYDGDGAVNVNGNWSDGVMSTPPALGVITNTDSLTSSWTGDNWNNKGVRQEAGYLFDDADNGLYLNQGTIYEIDDPRTDYASYTNLDVSGVFQIWHNTTAPTFRLLSGHAEAGLLNFLTVPTMDIGDGLFHVNGLTNQGLKGNYTFMSNKTGRVVIDDLNGLGLNHIGGCTLNFESGNTGSLTLGPNTGSGTAAMWFLNDMVAEWFSIDGVVETNPAAYLVTVDGDDTSIAKSPYSGYKRFVGQTAGWHFNPQGDLKQASNWEDSVLPSGSTTGLLANTVNVWTDGIWQDFALRQAGGHLAIAGDMALRGGTSGSGITSLYEIDDRRTDYASYTNLTIGANLVLWSQFGEEMKLNLISGHAVATGIKLLAGNKGEINVTDGILHAGLLSSANGYLNFLSGGSGQVVIDELEPSLLGNFYVDIASDSTGSLTFGSYTNGMSARSDLEWLVNNGHVSIDGAPSTFPGDFLITTTDGTNSTIQLSPYRNYPKFIGQNNDPDAPFGSLGVAANWEGGVLPNGSTTGLVSTTVNVWFDPVMTDFACLQTGGYVQRESMSMRGATSNIYSCLYMIDDPNPNYGSYTNMQLTGELSLWSQYKEPMDLKLLSGHVEINSMNAISGLAVSNVASEATITMKDGLMHVGTLRGGEGPDRGFFEVNIDMLAGGSGAMTFDSLVCTQEVGYLSSGFGINFETGNAGSITFGSQLTGSGTESASGIWAAMIANGQVSIDGVVETRAYMFDITQDSLASTIMLGDGEAATPTEIYASWIGGYGVSDPAMDADPDVDGYDNLFEYAVGGNPNDAGVNGNIPETSMTGDWFYYVHYERTDKDDVGLSYALEAGSDLVMTNWGSIALEPVGNGAGPAGYNVFTNRISTATEGKQFIKLDVGFTE